MEHEPYALSLCLAASQIVGDDHVYATISFGASARSESVRLQVTPPESWEDVRDWTRQILAAACEEL